MGANQLMYVACCYQWCPGQPTQRGPDSNAADTPQQPTPDFPNGPNIKSDHIGQFK